MTLKDFVTNRVRAIWVKHDLALVQDENFPFQMRVAVHVVKQLAQLDSVGEKGSESRSETLKKIASDEKYYLRSVDHEQCGLWLAPRPALDRSFLRISERPSFLRAGRC